MDGKHVKVLLIEEDLDELRLIQEMFKEIGAKDCEITHIPEAPISIITDLDDKISKVRVLRKEVTLEN